VRLLAASVPGWASSLPPGFATHTCDLVRFDDMAAARVLIIGGRQSAYEWAALIREHGAARIDIVHRHHLTSARTHFEGVLRDTSAAVVCGVGFADLSGFTALTQTLTPAELSAMLTEFGATVSDVVHADGGRVVKFLGDAVMWVSSDPERLAKVALDLVDHPLAREEGIQVRAGLGYGDDEIDAVIDDPAALPAKTAALLAHATQLTVGPTGKALALSNDLALPIVAQEHYVLAVGEAGDRNDRGWETDLLAGVDVAGRAAR